jgi:lipid II:glycine glycyltransferase (peptidoglycan interpeptide bridge formation enzyme)
MDLKCITYDSIDDLEKQVKLQSGYFQSYEYFKIQKQIGNDPIYFVVQDFDESSPTFGLNAINLFIYSQKDRVIRSIGEPSFFSVQTRPALNEILTGVDEYAKNKKVVLTIIDSLDFSMKQIYQQRGYKVKDYETSILNLEQSESELLTTFKKELRRLLKKDFDIIIKEISNIEDLIYSYTKCYEMSNKEIPDRFFEEAQYKIEYGSHKYYFAEDSKGNLLGTLAMVVCNGEAKELHSSLTQYAYDNKLPAQDFLHWHIIKEAKKLKCKTFNIAGFQKLPATPKEKGIKQFKLKYSGEVYPMIEFRKYYGIWRVYYGIKRLLSR